MAAISKSCESVIIMSKSNISMHLPGLAAAAGFAAGACLLLAVDGSSRVCLIVKSPGRWGSRDDCEGLVVRSGVVLPAA